MVRRCLPEQLPAARGRVPRGHTVVGHGRLLEQPSVAPLALPALHANALASCTFTVARTAAGTSAPVAPGAREARLADANTVHADAIGLVALIWAARLHGAVHAGPTLAATAEASLAMAMAGAPIHALVGACVYQQVRTRGAERSRGLLVKVVAMLAGPKLIALAVAITTPPVATTALASL